MWKKRIKRGDKVGLELSPAERKLLLTGLVFLHDDVEAAIRSTPPGGEVMLTLSDLEDLVGHVAGEANHAKTERIERILSDIFDKIEELLDFYAEAERPTTASKGSNTISDAPGEFLANPEPVILHMPKRSGDENRTYPIKMTPLQRKSLLAQTNLGDDLSRRIEQTPEGPQTIEFTRDNLEELYARIGDVIAYVRTPHRSRLMSLSRRIEAHFEQECDEAFGVKPPKGR
jgi:hypothetical protein